MLDAKLKGQLETYLKMVTLPLELRAALDDGPQSQSLRAVLQEIAELSPQITLREQAPADGQRVPSFDIARVDSDVSVRFAGIPLGHEFTSLVLALLQVGGHAPKLDDAVIEQIRALPGDYAFETYFSLSCQNCPDVVQALNTLSVINPRIRHVAIDGALFQDEVSARDILSVPSVFLNGELFHQGRAGVEELLAKLDSGASQAAAQALDAREPFDVLVVGGGPAGAAAAVYAARKGIRTGLVAERVGGQVLDTAAIENYLGVLQTDGPRFGAAMGQHVGQYEVDVMNQQRVRALIPGETLQLELENGAVLKAHSVVLAPGARWRHLDVPGEAEYANRGVAYCPHCDGPLFKGKRVAVIGGGNSGVEAAIDLAGLAAQVTLIEYNDALRADAILQRKLRSLANVEVLVNARTTEILGDGKRVTGLRYAARGDGSTHELALDGVFIQIGLLPNTEWLQGALTLSAHGEIPVDERCRTALPGVFAAGDATTVPYKQIVVAAGEGSKAALSAFDYLIRHSVEAESAAPVPA